MERLKINTPQNVNIDYGLASIGTRMLALGLDIAVIVAYIFVMSKLVSTMHIYRMDRFSYMGLIFLLYCPIFLYHFWMETFFKGQTIGKMVTKIKVVKTDGTRATIYEYFIRWTMNIVDLWMMGGIIGAFSTILSKKTQRVGDFAASTAVISLKPRLQLRETIYEEMNETYQIVYPQVIRLSDKDINLIKSKFNEARREENIEIIHALSQRLQKVMELNTIKTSDHVFIKTVLQDHFHAFKEK